MMDYSNYNTAPTVYRGTGMYTHHKPDQSIESKQFIKELIRESQLAHVHRKFMETIVENGKALPPLRSDSGTKRKDVKVLRPSYSGGKMGKRMQNDIRNSGAYEIEPYVPRCPQTNVEKEKARLQSLMAYGKVTLPEPLVKPKPRSKQKKEHLPSLEERFQIVLKEIEERSSFLNEMADLGQAEQYRAKMQSEISERVRELELLSQQMKNKLSLNEKCIEEFKQILPQAAK
ncbi:hypothetical protein M8J76_003844 [Diaphorina citri]|nr:hypothetical protein M8J76_003844 [Diaphorina citri]